MKIYEFSHKEGLVDFHDFITGSLRDNDERDDQVLDRLGFNKSDELFSKDSMMWIVVYKNDHSSDFEYVVSIENPADYQYIVCRTFPDYLEFMRQYLPTLRDMRTASTEHYDSVKAS